MPLRPFPAAATFVASLAFAAPAQAYDDTWYKADIWAGEYPSGFTLESDVVTKIRDAADPDAPRTIDCALKKGETYHPWNEARVRSSKLEFVSFEKKVEYVVRTPNTLTIYNEKTESDVEVAFAAGDVWTYLAYYAIGTFRLEFQGTHYKADHALVKISFLRSGKLPDHEHTYDEWLKLTCANGPTGWLLFADVAEDPQFKQPNFPEYGKALDAQ